MLVCMFYFDFKVIAALPATAMQLLPLSPGFVASITLHLDVVKAINAHIYIPPTMQMTLLILRRLLRPVPPRIAIIIVLFIRPNPQFVGNII